MIWKTLESFYQYFNPENSTENTTTTMDTDTDTDIEGLRIQGNNFYSANEYWSAIDAYSQALELSTDNAIILGNRSACYLAIEEYEKAENDARLAISIKPSFVKCYFRLATALKARNALQEAIEVIDLGLLQDSTSEPLKKFKLLCIKGTTVLLQEPQQNSSENNDDSVTIKKGFLQQLNKCTKSSSNKEKEEEIPKNFPTEIINDINEAAVGSVEYLMITELKSLIKRILTGNYGSEDMNKHMLYGVFKQLMDKETFSEILFPGASKAVQRDLPMNLKDLLSWDILSLDLSKIANKAASIFNGIKSKGELRGDFMDRTTEAILIPQIVEEAMARDIVGTVRNLSKKVSGLNAKVSLALALPTEEEASWDQIGLEVTTALGSYEFALGIQSEFLGSEWSSLVLEDVIRYVADEKMTEMGNGTSILISPNNDPYSSIDGDVRHGDDVGLSRMAWIEQDAITESYPALGELLQQLHALPYEINAKSDCALRLLQPARGCTMIVHFSAGSKQPIRMDNRENEFDSGIRVTCAYNLIPGGSSSSVKSNGSESSSDSSSNDNSSGNSNSSSRKCKGPIAQLLYSMHERKNNPQGSSSNEDSNSGKFNNDNSSNGNSNSGNGESNGTNVINRLKDMRTIDVEHDQLMLHQSVKVRNARSPATSDYFVIYYFIHGK